MGKIREFFDSLGGITGLAKVPTAPLQVDLSDLLRNLAQIDPSQLISRRLFTSFNPEVLVTRKGLAIFDLMKRDEQVKAALRFKKDSILSSGWEIVSPDDEDKDWEPTRFIRDQLTKAPGGWEANMRKILLGIDYGYSVTEKVFKQLDEGEWAGKIGLGKMISVKPHFIDFTQDEFGTILSIVQRSVSSLGQGTGQIGDAQYPPGKFVIYTHNQEFENPYGISDLIAAYRPWWIKDNAYKWLAMYLERFGMPPLMLMYNSGAYQGNQLAELKKLIKNLQTATFGMIPRLNKEDIEIWSQQLGAQSKEIYLDSLDKFDRDICRSLLVPGLLGFSADEGAGSLARSNTHFDSFILVTTHLQIESAGVVNSQIVKPLCDLNYPSLEKYPEFRYLPFKDDKRLEMLALWQTLVAGKVVGRTEEDEPHIRKALDMPDNDKVVLEPLPADANRQAQVDAADKLAKTRTPVPGKQLSPKQKKFAEENDGTWFYVGDEMVCLSNPGDFIDDTVTFEGFVRRRGNKWVVVSHTGKVLGTHDNEEDAKAQLRAIEAHKHGGG